VQRVDAARAFRVNDDYLLRLHGEDTRGRTGETVRNRAMSALAKGCRREWPGYLLDPVGTRVSGSAAIGRSGSQNRSNASPIFLAQSRGAWALFLPIPTYKKPWFSISSLE
jgi:hypothetical protein